MEGRDGGYHRSVLCVPACRGGACVATVWWRCTYPIWMARTARAVPTALLLGRSCGFGPHRPIRLRSQLLLSQVVPSSHASEGAVVVLPRTLCGAHTSAVATHVAQTDTHTCGHFLPSPDAHLSMQGPLGLGRPIRCDQQERVETAMPSITLMGRRQGIDATGAPSRPHGGATPASPPAKHAACVRARWHASVRALPSARRTPDALSTAAAHHVTEIGVVGRSVSIPHWQPRPQRS